jgi:hypothetical protein
MALVGIWSPFDVCSWSECGGQRSETLADHAIKTRVSTDGMKDPKTTQIMSDLADDYDKLADRNAPSGVLVSGK